MKKILAILSALIIFSVTGCGDPSTAVDNVKKDAAAQVKETASEVKETAEKIEQKATAVTNGGQSSQHATEKFSLGGIYPGMTLDEVKNIFGEPSAQHDNEEFTFANGVVVEIDKHNDAVKEIKTHQAGVKTGAGVEVGMTEQNLIDACGAADYVENHDGKVEHKYNSADRLFKMEFEIRNGQISEIKIQLDD